MPTNTVAAQNDRSFRTGKSIAILLPRTGPEKGRGYLAGELPTTSLGAVTPCEVRALYRPVTNGEINIQDGAVVGFTTSDAQGKWQLLDLDPALKFDVVARLPGFNDVIRSNVSPIPYDIVSLSGTFNVSGNILAGTITAEGGYPGAYVVTVFSGTAPPGITFSAAGHAVTASGSTSAGTYDFTLQVTAPNGVYARKVLSLTVL